MAETTKIEWCDATFNPWIGCSKIHQGCANCDAERDFDKRRGFAKWGPHGTRVLTSEANWRKPETWNRKAEKEGRRMRVFCASLADVFEDWQGEITDSNGNRMMACRACRHVDLVEAGHGFWEAGIDGYSCPVCEHTADLDAATLDDVRRRLFALIDSTPWLDWLLVTKRPENVLKLKERAWPLPKTGIDLHRRNVWILTSVSDQATADKMVPELLRLWYLVPVLGLSIEPLLGPIDLTQLDNGSGETFDALRNEVTIRRSGENPVTFQTSDCGKLNWIIVGGESGPDARPMHPNWVRSLRDQATSAGVAFHYKQWGEWAPWEGAGIGIPGINGRRINDHGQDITCIPELWCGDHVTDAYVYPIGKAKAGRLLDGRTWDEFPAARVQ
jgi:protein gp37